MSDKPVMHGNDHGIRGMDPVVRPWAYLFKAGQTTSIAANGGSGSAATRLVIPSTYSFYTTAPDVFTVDKTTHGGTDYYGIVFNALGHYDINCAYISIDTPTGAVYTLQDDGSGGSDSLWTQGPNELNFTPIQAPAGVFTVDLNLGEIQTVDATSFPPPTTPLVFEIENFTNLTFHGGIVTRVEYLDKDQTFL